MKYYDDDHYVPSFDPPHYEIRNTNEFTNLAIDVGRLLTEVHNRYLATYAEAYTPYRKQAPLDTVLLNVPLQHALANAHKSLTKCFASLLGAQKGLTKAFDIGSRTGIELCTHCQENEITPRRHKELCSTCYAYRIRTGELPPIEVLNRRHNRLLRASRS